MDLKGGFVKEGLLTTMDKKKLLEDTDLFVLDMDGTFYLGDNILPGALSFIEAATKKGKDYLFFTNNACSPLPIITLTFSLFSFT